jgi:hypothetical protein
MVEDSLRRGIESMVAGFLRAHVVEAVLSRPEVVRSMSPEALEKLRRDVTEHLAKAETEGRDDRATVRQVVGALGRSGLPGASLIAGVLERAMPSDPTDEGKTL